MTRPDMTELRRRERWAELADSLAAEDRRKARRARRHARISRFVHFWLSPFQVADGPKGMS